MGFAIPAAIGAAMAKKRGNVYVITGDGSYNFMSHNASTVGELGIRNLEIYVLNNDGYKTIRDSQQTWCSGREIGLMDGMRYSQFGLVFELDCGDYEVRRPIVA
jgi:acetolactate synthase-1/2/3 large subunit